MDDRILAALMPAPLQPVEVRELRRPDLVAGSALLRAERAEVCGGSAGILTDIRGPVSGLGGSPLREGDRAVFFGGHRTRGRCRACTIHRRDSL